MSQDRKLAPSIWHPTYLLNRQLGSSVRGLVSAHFYSNRTRRLLDVGCGSMPYRSLFEGHVHEYVGCDMYSAQPGVIVCPAHALAFEDESFDAVVCFQVIEHTDQPWLVVSEIARVLKPGGIAIITAPFMFPHHASPHDYFRYTEEGVYSLARRARLKPISFEAQCGAFHTLIMLTSIKFVEKFGGLRRIPIMKHVYAFAEGSFVTTLNLVGLIASGHPNLRKPFPAYANFAAAFTKQ